MRLILSSIALLLSSPALEAHEWYARHRDPVFSQTSCCGGSDCAPLPAHAIQVTPDGLRVTLTEAEANAINPTRFEAFDELIPFERIQVSEDGMPHICLMPHNMDFYGDERQGFYCIFLPPNG